jgi:hypothetical protein
MSYCLHSGQMLPKLTASRKRLSRLGLEVCRSTCQHIHRSPSGKYFFSNLIPWSGVSSTIVPRVVKKFSRFYGLFTRALHWYLSCARLIEITPSEHVPLRLILVSYPDLCTLTIPCVRIHCDKFKMILDMLCV